MELRQLKMFCAAESGNFTGFVTLAWRSHKRVGNDEAELSLSHSHPS